MKKRVCVLLVVAFLFTPFIKVCNAADEEAVDPTAQRYYTVLYNDIVNTSPMGAEWADWMARAIIYFSAKHGVNPLLAAANFKRESGYNMQAVSRTGAIGVAQLMPKTAAAIGVDPYDPAGNIEGGIIYLAQQLAKFQYSGDWNATYAIAAYNAGPDAILKYGGVPPYEETCNHVNAVAANLNKLIADFNSL